MGYLDPISVGQCEMTSTKLKRAADSVWATIEEHICPRATKRSKNAQSAKGRIVRQYIASKFCRGVEARTLRNRKEDSNCKPQKTKWEDLFTSHMHPTFILMG